jgi:quinol monooxygenase YgiN
MAYVLTAKWTAREDEVPAVEAALRRLIAATRTEPGNLVYQCHRDPSDPRVFLLYEMYEDEAAFQAHASSPHFDEYAVHDAIPRLESRERHFYVTWE